MVHIRVMETSWTYRLSNKMVDSTQNDITVKNAITIEIVSNGITPIQIVLT